jgi:Leucine-rich repeat (LRR) protein
VYTARNLEDALAAPEETGELYLAGRGFTDFPQEIFKLPNLRLLDLNQNLIRQLPEEIASLKFLEVINLRNNQLRSIPSEIGQLQRLHRLELDENQLAELPQELSQCDSLRTLRLSHNSFQEWPEDALPPRIESLTIAHNRLTQLPDSIRHLHALTYLDLRHNRLRTLPESLAIIEGLGQVLLEGNPLELAVESNHPEGVAERFFKELRQYVGGSSKAKYPSATRKCWLRMLFGATHLLEEFSLEVCITALDSPLSTVREAARMVLPRLLPSPLPKEGPASILLAGQFLHVPKMELEKALIAAGFTVLRRFHQPPMIVALGERPGNIRLDALKWGNPIAFEGHLETWLAQYKGEFLAAAPVANPLNDNLRRLLRSHKKENIEMALVMMARAGTPGTLRTDLLAIRLFHVDAEVRQKTGAAFAQAADRSLKAFVDRQIQQHYKEEDLAGSDYDVQALVTALVRNPDLDAETLVGAAIELKGAGLGLMMLLPVERHAQYFQQHLKDGQLNLSGIGLTAFPPALGDLKGLRYLMLARNQLTALPEDMGPFSQLEMLDLSENHLTALPESISQLRHLKGLDLSQNRLRNLPESMGELTELEALRLDRNPLQGLPTTLLNLKQLELLGLYGCRFSQMPGIVWELGHLRALDVGECNLRQLPGNIEGFAQLESLSMKDNPIQNLPEWIGQFPALRFLDLSLIPARTLPQGLYAHPRLERIYLIRDDSMDWEQVIPILATMPRLKHVYLRGRKIVRAMQLMIEEKLPRVRVFWNG